MSRRPTRRGRSAALGVLAVMAGACPGAAADETHGDVNLPALTPEEIQELGLEAAPPSDDTTAPGAQDVDAGQIPDDQDTGAPSPEESVPEPEPEPVPSPAQPPATPVAPAPAAPAPVAPAPAPAVPAPTPAAPPPPVADPGPAPTPVRQRARTRRPQRVTPPPIGRQPEPVRPAPAIPRVAPVVPRPAAVPTPAPVRAATAAVSRVVQAGESLWSIAADRLGPGASAARIAAEVERLWRLNRGHIRSGSPDVLPAGIALRT